ncbi:cucumisin-like [Corylus avellana]|uniref:cucumisin-like n=1 Tax=Corylus avellana TaxID=13451 RepID=UPI00286AB295|nr:cucumisin-like [Corylus avellana]
MASKTSTSSTLSWLLLLCLAFTLLVGHSTSQNDRKAYIVYMGDRKMDEVSTSSLHTSMLQDVIGSTGPESLIYSYSRSFSGFAAELTEQEAQKIVGMEGVVSVFPSEQNQLHTTRSWDFLGFPQNVTRRPIESDIIIGVLDTGIWPESESFNDTGFGPAPTKWKGTCQATINFTCNNKIIGAKYYRSSGVFVGNDVKSPRDSNGHGTHTASIAAGNLVSGASLLGYASGTARGGVPSARIAVYKICWSNGCSTADILKAFDDAIADGVDIISFSVGTRNARDYFRDVNAIGAFHAMRNGILTSMSAGNYGPRRSTTANVSPWALSVAASTIDRKFSTQVQLGNNNTYEGISINTFDLNNTQYPIIYGGDAPNTGVQSSTSRYCYNNSLDQALVKGKIVLCDIRTNGAGAFIAGAIGTVMQGQAYQDYAKSYPLPASYLRLVDGSKVYSYINSTRGATATIQKSKEVNDTNAPYIVAFSSRGPSNITRNILKPDLAAPGVHILAAWSQISPISRITGDKRLLPYNIDSGTSMACPHATGAAAYVKSFHPTWSPAAIKSALMTTAIPMTAQKNLDAEYAYGAGYINPLKAPQPGLIYDIDALDYVNFLCVEGYNTSLLRLVTGDNSTCSGTTNGTVFDLNYPSFTIFVSPSKNFSQVYHRTITNVGSPTSTYKATVTGTPVGLRIEVKPNVLAFTSLGQNLTFALIIEGTTSKDIVSASLVWDDGTFQVRSPIVVGL